MTRFLVEYETEEMSCVRLFDVVGAQDADDPAVLRAARNVAGKGGRVTVVKVNNGRPPVDTPKEVRDDGTTNAQ